MATIFRLEDIVEPLSREQCETALYGYLDTVGAPVSDWKRGGVVHTIIYVFCILFSWATFLIAGIAQSGFSQLAEGVWLKVVAKYTYGLDLTQFEATFAQGNLVLTNNSAQPYNVEAYDLTATASALDKTYRNTEAFVLPAKVGTTPGTVTVAVQATEQGAASTATAGQIDSLVTSLAGVTVTNPGVVLGLDEASKETIRAACVASAAMKSPHGPALAYEWAAKTALRADGSNVGVSKVRTVNDSAGHLDVFVAKASGGVAGTAQDLATDLGRVSDSVHRNASVLGITVDVSSANVVPLAVAYEAWIYTSVNETEAAVKSAQSSALARRVDLLPIGGDRVDNAGVLYQSTVGAAIYDAFPQHTIRVKVNSPGDTTLQLNDVVRFDGATGIIHWVQPAEGT